MSAITGSQTSVFSGHSHWVRSVTFSSDGVFLVSGSEDKTIKLWDTQTGGCIRTFQGHDSWVYSVYISTDSTMIASGDIHGEIRLWNIQTGECHHVIGYYNNRLSLTHSQNLMVMSGDKIQQLDINGNKIGPEHTGSYVASSLDGTQFALCNKSTVTVQDSRSRALISKFHVGSHTVNHCCFSPDGRFIAVSVDSIIYVWNITSSTPCLIEMFIGHTRKIAALTFSSPSSLISTSKDKSVKFWQIGTLSAEPTGVDLMSTIHHQDEVKSITLQAKDGITITSDSDGVIKIWDILTGHCKESLQTPAKGVWKRDVRLVDDMLVIAWSVDDQINIWDVRKQELLLTVPHDFPIQLRISGDRSTIFCLHEISVVALSIQTGECIGSVSFFHMVSAAFLAVDGSRIFLYISTQYNEYNYEVLDSFTQLSDEPPTKLHPSGNLLWDIGLSRVQDIPSGKVLFQLNIGLGKPVDAQWMDQYLAICFASGKVLVLDFSYALLQ